MKSYIISGTIRRAFAAALLLVAYGTGAQAQQLAGGQVDVHSKQITRQGNKVHVAIDLNMDKLMLKSNKGLVLTPMLANGSDTLRMPPVEIMGHNDISIICATNVLPRQTR